MRAMLSSIRNRFYNPESAIRIPQSSDRRANVEQARDGRHECEYVLRLFKERVGPRVARRRAAVVRRNDDDGSGLAGRGVARAGREVQSVPAGQVLVAPQEGEGILALGPPPRRTAPRGGRDA